jgi:predicted AAA+ superfamily ATPase
MKRFFRQPWFDRLEGYLKTDPLLIQVISGPRQVGKSTLASQILERWKGPRFFETADHPTPPDSAWIVQAWQRARARCIKGKTEPLLVFDEVQKIPRWSETIKGLFDQDCRQGRKLRVLLLGSSALLVQRGLTESLAGRFELHRLPHWSYSECRACFSVTLEDYLRFGGYPRGLLLRNDPARWARFIRDTLIETVLGKDVLLMSPIQKPALLRQAFGIACAHPAEIVSYQKMLGQLADAGNATTLVHYFDLLAAAFLVAPLPRWSGNRLRQKASTPKLIVRDNALVNAMKFPSGPEDTIEPAWRGRLMENAVGATLVSRAEQDGSSIFYWRDRDVEVDLVLRKGGDLLGVEIKSGVNSKPFSGLQTFQRRYPGARIKAIVPGRTPRAIPSLTPREFFKNPQRIWE